MRNIKIVFHSPFGVCERIAETVKNGIVSSHPEMTVTSFSLAKAGERATEKPADGCDLLIIVFPACGRGAPTEVARYLKKSEIKATFASAVCAYGKGDPIFALRKVKYLLRSKNIPLVSAMDIPVGRITPRDGREPTVPEFEASAFAEGTMMNADVGKRIVLRAQTRSDTSRLHL